LKFFLTDFKRPYQRLPFHRIADGAFQMLAREIAFDQIVLYTVMHRLHRQYFVILAGKHNHRHVGRMFHDPAEGFRPAAIGQVQVQ
jgi:hypothetical protein